MSDTMPVVGNESYEAPPIYAIFDDHEELKPNMINYLSIMADLHNEGFKDPATIAKTEVFMIKFTCFNHSLRIDGHMVKTLYEALQAYTKLEQRSFDACARDIWSYYREDIINCFNEDKGSDKILEAIDRYIEFKKSIDDVSPEAAEEIDKLVKMSDEEFQEELDKQEREFDEEIDRQFERKYDPDYDIPDELYEE